MALLPTEPVASGTIYTIGHSTRSGGEFLDLLRSSGVRQLADIRRFPASRRLPHFNLEPLRRVLEAAGILYRHLEALGGRRSPRSDSPHTAWKVDQFRGYADHMETVEFAAALSDLERWSVGAPTAIMCAEALYFRCHRRMTSDALLRDGFEVLHITGPGRLERHQYPPFARLEPETGRLVYDGGQLELG
jgi:uncharacterized protein (DUF488 family)